ncbi:MAG: DUF4112 domain-containing protein [Roseofilum sp. SBFL]|uniref:DUF4112 domain-containing protein n=1 Tax=unclassified Roseofilum TaxID=2620099 RepID=UPI001B298B81|nr:MULTISPECIES: DUF4112 domain-containing protein [unclassified Roseofilum]MBP0014512.1 DUF4112 domain-containing protein [Roseofilum sp. SID3]MBP0024839.1 DUF4112 domain-containing protein [Roseofilum sp. SID2]MBP0038705.1 DUF4112 domain-containing protein [Roseofilum sp. SID1]MBP0041224.1 DUF4112 domain-containing protein [Roseofilum sp. SBFL]
MEHKSRESEREQGSKRYRIQRLRRLSQLLDNALPIPGLNYRVGIDPIIGLIPGGGDMVSGILSAYIVLEATRFGLPKETLGRMVINVLIDTLTGIVPILGDLFDLTWKANAMNVELLEEHLQAPKSSEAADRGFIIVMIMSLALIVVGVTSFGLFLLWGLTTLMNSLF